MWSNLKVDPHSPRISQKKNERFNKHVILYARILGNGLVKAANLFCPILNLFSQSKVGKHTKKSFNGGDF